eukprot:7903639-Heterocapsa_arctica.AAC.1
MATPRRCDWQKVKRLARYLVGVPRMVQKINWQESPDRITSIVDTDYVRQLFRDTQIHIWWCLDARGSLY